MVGDRTILIIDDDIVLSDLYRVKFTRAGYTVVVCHNGQEGFDALAKGLQPDIILLDVIMPTMDGFAFLRETAHKQIPLPPVIIMTSQQEDIYKVEATIRGAHSFVPKATATPKEILERIEEILKNAKGGA